MKILFTIILTLFFTELFNCQTKISGKITDTENQPLPGANIFIKDSYDGVSSLADGTFSFTTYEEGDAVLVVSFVGYQTKEESIQLTGKEINIVIILEEDVQELGEVVISAGSFEASDEKKSVILRPLDIVTTGSDGDIYSALETLPGTQQIGETEGLFVRGGSASETVTIIDELVVQKPFYTSVPDIPARGRFSPFLFKGIMFSTGGYSAKYGQALSSALILNSQGIAKETLTAINLMILGLGGAHVHRWENSSLAFEGSYYNLAPYFNIVKQRQDWEKAPTGIESSLNYRLKTSATGLLKAFASYNHSNLSLHLENPDDIFLKDYFGLRSDNYYSNLSFNEIFGEDWTFYAGASFSLDKDRYDLNADKVKQDEILNQGKIYVSKHIINSSFITIGGDVQNMIYKNSFNDINSRIDEIYLAGFIETDFFFTNDFAARIGLRGEHSNLIDKYNLAPRVSLAYRIGTYDQLNFAYGKYYQTPFKDFLIQTTNLGFENATHYIFNYQHISESRTFRIEFYYKKYDNLVKGNLFQPPFIEPVVPFNNNGSGYAKGIDVFWRDRETFDMTDYWISYSYLDTKRDFINFPGLATPTFATPHTLSIVVKRWVPAITTYFGLTYTFATGRPYYNPNNPEYLGDRTKNYNNLSFNFSYVTSMFHSLTVVFFSIDNILGFKNIYGYNYSSDGTFRSPILPTADRSAFIGMFISIGEQSPN